MIASFIVFFCPLHLINQINLTVSLDLWKLKLLLIAALQMSKDHWPAWGERDVLHFFVLSLHKANNVSEVVSGVSALSVLTNTSYWPRVGRHSKMTTRLLITLSCFIHSNCSWFQELHWAHKDVVLLPSLTRAWEQPLCATRSHPAQSAESISKDNDECFEGLNC